MATPGKTHQLIVQALSSIDRKDLANLWGCTLAEVSKKLSGKSNINIEDMAKALAEADVQLIIGSNMRAVDVDELQALNLFSSRYIARRLNKSDD